jgi:hypothetical protein
MSDEYYYTKYLKYKAKYLNLIKQTGGSKKYPTCKTEKEEPEEGTGAFRGRNVTVCCENKGCDRRFFTTNTTNEAIEDIIGKSLGAPKQN